MASAHTVMLDIKRMARGLKEQGAIIEKENTWSVEEITEDKDFILAPPTEMIKKTRNKFENVLLLGKKFVTAKIRLAQINKSLGIDVLLAEKAALLEFLKVLNSIKVSTGVRDNEYSYYRKGESSRLGETQRSINSSSETITYWNISQSDLAVSKEEADAQVILINNRLDQINTELSLLNVAEAPSP